MSRARGAAVAIAAAALGAALAASPRDAGAWCRTTTQRSSIPGECSRNGVPLSWRNACTGFSLHVDGSPDVPMDVLRRESTAAAERWHRIPCDANSRTVPYFQLRTLPDTVTLTGYNGRGPNANTVSFNSVWRRDASHREGTIAITVVTFDTMTGEILDADIELNQRSTQNPNGYQFTAEPPDAAVSRDSADLPTILTHEFGHFLGVAHSESDAAVMWPEAGLGEQRRNLRNDDRDVICEIYAPQDAPQTECNPVPFGGFAVTPTGGRVTGGCVVAPPPPPPLDARETRTAYGLAAIVAAALVARRAQKRRR